MSSSLLINVPAFAATTHAGHLSKRYRQYSTAALVEPLLNEGWEITGAFQSPTRTHSVEHAKHLVRVTHPTLQLGHERLEGLITNSHDGSSPFRFQLGAWRIVCSNGIILGDHYANVEISHRRAFEAVKHQAARLIERAPEVATVFDAWKTRSTSSDERHQLATYAVALRWPENAPIEPQALLSIRRDEDRTEDLWTVFNRIQENILRGKTEHKPERRAPRAVRSLDANVRINQRLWDAAEAIYDGEDLVLPS